MSQLWPILRWSCNRSLKGRIAGDLDCVNRKSYLQGKLVVSLNLKDKNYLQSMRTLLHQHNKSLQDSQHMPKHTHYYTYHWGKSNC
jgi:hypothetical protein